MSIFYQKPLAGAILSNIANFGWTKGEAAGLTSQGLAWEAMLGDRQAGFRTSIYMAICELGLKGFLSLTRCRERDIFWL